MAYSRSLLVWTLAAFLFAAPLAWSEEPPAPAPEPPTVVPEEVALRALERFEEAYRAKGLKGDDKLSERDFAMSELAKVQHPLVVKALAKIARSRDATLRTLATIYLGEQTALPGLAGPEVLTVLKRNPKDDVLVLSALQSLGNLRYLGAKDEIAALLDHKDFVVKKAAISAAGDIGEMRLWKEILKLAGVVVKESGEVGGADESKSKEEVVEEGWSYEGVEVTVDTGAAGDADQKAAEKIGKEKLAANKAKAGGGGGLGGGSARGAGGAARSPKELLPAVLQTLYELTGERFLNSKEVAEWVRKHREEIDLRNTELDEREKSQEEAAKEQKR